MSIGKKLKQWRTLHGYSQKVAGSLLGIPLSTYKKYETDRLSPGSDAIASFMGAGIRPEWLFTGEEPMLAKDVVLPDTPARTFPPAEQWDDPATTLRLEAIWNALNAYGDIAFPLTPAWLAEHAECIEYKGELQRIALGGQAGPDQKARADWLLSGVYDDPEAKARCRERDRHFRERSENASLIITRLGRELGYDAPMIWTLLIHELLEYHGLDEDGARRILETLRNTPSPG